MDAYSQYIRQLSDARLGELRREAAEYAMSKAARHGRSRWLAAALRWARRPAWARVGNRRRAPALDSGMTIRAEWNDTVLAESDDTVVVEGNHYFPRDAIRHELFEEAPTTSFCPWKGTASYYDVVVDGTRNAAAAWYYPEPKDEAAEIRDRVAFWKGVRVSEV